MALSVNETGLYSLAFEQQGLYEVASLRYWKADRLVKVQLVRHSPSSHLTQNQLLTVARFFSFLSTTPQMVCMTECTSDVLEAVEQSSLLSKGIEYPFRCNVLTLHSLMRKREGSVFGRIDIYTQVKYLVAFLAGSLDELWMAHIPELAKVGLVNP